MFHNETVHNLVSSDLRPRRVVRSSPAQRVPLGSQHFGGFSSGHLESVLSPPFLPGYRLVPRVSGFALGCGKSPVAPLPPPPAAGLLRVVQCLDISSSGWRLDL